MQKLLNKIENYKHEAKMLAKKHGIFYPIVSVDDKEIMTLLASKIHESMGVSFDMLSSSTISSNVLTRQAFCYILHSEYDISEVSLAGFLRQRKDSISYYIKRFNELIDNGNEGATNTLESINQSIYN